MFPRRKGLAAVGVGGFFFVTRVIPVFSLSLCRDAKSKGEGRRGLKMGTKC